MATGSRTRRTGLVVAVVLAVVAGLAAVGLIVRGELAKQGDWAQYAGVYEKRSGDRLELRDDGTWSLTYAGGTETVTNGVPGGDVADLDWTVLAPGAICQECRDLYTDPPEGDPLIYVPSMVTSTTRWAGSDMNVSTNGDYYGVAPDGSLRDEDGRRWVRVS